jgi:hypothetical protein
MTNAHFVWLAVAELFLSLCSVLFLLFLLVRLISLVEILLLRSPLLLDDFLLAVRLVFELFEHLSECEATVVMAVRSVEHQNLSAIQRVFEIAIDEETRKPPRKGQHE